ncbi:MAG TPA: hypothetical protein VG709_03665 [Actinomycetota bacterium]|nr:hypothetical protein [Actinomycetota bacterium]
MKRTRRLILSLLLVIGVVAPALPASAHFTQFEVAGITYHFGLGTTFAGIRFTCADGEKYQIRTKVEIKPDYEGIGRASGRCTGTEETIWVESRKQSGELRARPARIVARGLTFLGGVQHGDAVKDVERF